MSSGPPSYTSQDNNHKELPSLLYDADSLPRKTRIPPEPNHRPPPPPPPSNAPPEPPLTPAKPPAYDNPGMVLDDEIDRIRNGSPATQPRTDSLPRDQVRVLLSLCFIS